MSEKIIPTGESYQYVYHARYISEDTNPWDANESYGVWRSLELAKRFGFEAFDNYLHNEGNVVSWVKHDDPNYLGPGVYTGHGIVETWERVEHDPSERPEAEGSYGMYIFKEPLRG